MSSTANDSVIHVTVLTSISTPDWVAMGADRRLTSRDAFGRVIWQADADTKIVVVDGEHLVGYAGALLDERGFFFWLAGALEGFTRGSLPERIRQALVDHWMDHPELKGVGIVVAIVGYAVHDGRPIAEHVHVSNSRRTPDGSFLLQEAGATFTTYRTSLLSPDYLTVAQDGVQMDGRDIQEHFAGIRELRSLSAETIPVLYRSFISFHADASEFFPGEVGRTCVIVTLPRKAFGDGSLAVPVGPGRGSDPGSNVVAVFADPENGGNDYASFTPGIISTLRRSSMAAMIGPVWISRSDSEIAIPVPGPITIESSGVPGGGIVDQQ